MMLINPIAFEVFGFEVRWYGVLMATAVLFAVMIAYFRAENFGVKRESLMDFVVIAVPLAFVGARTYYVIFNLSYYRGNFFHMINVREGGLAIHGALIVGAVVAILFCKFNKLNIWNFLDLAVPSVAIGQAIGRWGNYFNQEAYGSPTDLPWAITIGNSRVHPTFLYESLFCLFLFFLLILMSKNRKFQGQIALLYCMLYSFERFFVEYLRTDSLMLFGLLKQAMVLSALVFLVSLVLYVLKSRAAMKEGRIFVGGQSKYKGKFKR